LESAPKTHEYFIKALQPSSYSYDRFTAAMDTEAVDVFCILKPVFFVSKVLGLSPYSAVGDIGNRNIIVTLSGILYGIGMVILTVGQLPCGVLADLLNWENICTCSESIMILETLCLAIFAYCTSLLGCRQTAKQFARLNDLIGETYYCVWKVDLQLLVIIQVVFIIMIVTSGVLDVSQLVREFYELYPALSLTIYYVSELVGFMSEHQFVVFMHIIKRTVQRWNNHIDSVSENENIINSPFYRNLINGEKSILITVSNKPVASKREKIHSNVVNFQKLRELHASACDIAESVNAIYSPMLLLSVARSFTSLTHILYYILMNFIVQKRSFYCKFSENTAYFVWLVYGSASLIMLVYFTALTAKEVSHKVYYFFLFNNYVHK
jgi:hypothetical protein